MVFVDLVWICLFIMVKGIFCDLKEFLGVLISGLEE